jgi:hypothetical protein
MPTKPVTLVLKNGIYECQSCVPPSKLAADGADHALPGSPYHDSGAVTIIDDHTVRSVLKKAGKVVDEAVFTVSADGTTLVETFSDSSATNAAPVTGTWTGTRIDARAPGAHALSGNWHPMAYEGSDNGLITTFKLDGDILTMSTPTGQSYAAKLDGKEAPYLGDPGTTAVSLRRVGDNAIEETDKRGDKIISVTTMTVKPDGKTMKVDVEDRLYNDTMSWTATKQ